MLQIIPMTRGAVKTCKKAVSICVTNAEHGESNFLSPKHRFRIAAARVPAPGTRLRTKQKAARISGRTGHAFWKIDSRSRTSSTSTSRTSPSEVMEIVMRFPDPSFN